MLRMFSHANGWGAPHKVTELKVDSTSEARPSNRILLPVTYVGISMYTTNIKYMFMYNNNHVNFAV